MTLNSTFNLLIQHDCLASDLNDLLVVFPDQDVRVVRQELIVILEETIERGAILFKHGLSVYH